MSGNVQSSGESAISERLQVRLISGETGETVYDSEEGKPELVYPDKPLKFCTNCGGDVQAVIYMCKCCGERFVQTMDKKTKRVMTIQLPHDAEDEKDVGVKVKAETEPKKDRSVV